MGSVQIFYGFVVAGALSFIYVLTSVNNILVCLVGIGTFGRSGLRLWSPLHQPPDLVGPTSIRAGTVCGIRSNPLDERTSALHGSR